MNRVAIIIALFLVGFGYAFGQTVDPTVSTPVTLNKDVDYRICGTVNRDANGVIVRSDAVKSKFQRIHPCPSTGLRTGACPGWSKDHVIPLDCGGCDAVENMQWLKNTIKSCSGTECKDRWERKTYCTPTIVIPYTPPASLNITPVALTTVQ